MSGPVPLRPALKTVDDGDGDRPPSASSFNKAVQIAEPITESPTDDSSSPAPTFRAASSRRSTSKPGSSSAAGAAASGQTAREGTPSEQDQRPQSSNRYQYYSEKLLAQVGDWLERERHKAQRRVETPRRRKSPPTITSAPREAESLDTRRHGEDGATLKRCDSAASLSSQVSLDKLQDILDDSLANLGLAALPRSSPKASRPRRRSSARPTLQRNASSDTDYADGDATVPDCDAWLDNTKTIGCTDANTSTDDVATTTLKTDAERAAWLSFKNDIIRIAHTLRLKGWRRVGLDQGVSIKVERLSGALTNAVYVVAPPGAVAPTPPTRGKHAPAQVLLRIYGPQVEHLIDRDNELMVLQRLARKKIGPRLLGTFRNGRFEEYFHALALRPLELRDADTSRQIAKRMRELHDGIDLLPQERDQGPGVWRNWDQWLDNVAKITRYLDGQLERTTGNLQLVQHHQQQYPNSVIHAWKVNGYVCGVPWDQFRETVAKYRAHLNSFYKDHKEVKGRLVFAHNDTQYGNILRLRPDDEKSPLLQAANKHKQLIVIDFEYAAANVPGLDFANHFTEWCYNYHDPVAAHVCNTERYPTVEEQRRFIRAYVDHRPQFPTASATPRLRPADQTINNSIGNGGGGGGGSGNNNSPPAQPPPLLPSQSSSSFVDFVLDARAPPGGWGAAERDREERSARRVRELEEETRLWRLANTAQWVAWSIIQATVPGLDPNNEPLSEAEAALAEREAATGGGDFDYLSYAQDRALFFWGDAVQLGLVTPEELPVPLRARIKTIDR